MCHFYCYQVKYGNALQAMIFNYNCYQVQGGNTPPPSSAPLFRVRWRLKITVKRSVN